ncbi:AMP-binding protein [Actinomyces minihominis]|uniref:AMP-binding protein n=1 Tax=Actinomyces minihominis TaxID=2002838 RepID=UPI000C07AE11|nr:AMP-binding protein [Actinomyces minihominis]
MGITFVAASDRSAAAAELTNYLLHGHTGLAVLGDNDRSSVQRIVEAEGSDRRFSSDPSHSLIVATSGSTGGSPHLVCLSKEALIASANATHDFLGGPGRWLSALPLQHIAGMQTVLRSALSGHAPYLHEGEHFAAPDFLASVARARATTDSGVPLYTSLVSPQLAACLDLNPEVLSQLDAILVGGGFIDPTLLERARHAGINVITTYGMTETAGGCVYNGFPLSGAEVKASDNGTLLISGPMVMNGYLDQPSPLLEENGRTWFVTSDLGVIGGDGRISLTGRTDDIVNTGGVKVNLRDIEEHSAKVSGLRSHVLSLTDPTWGQTVALLLEDPRADSISTAQIESRAQAVREGVRDALGPASAPRVVSITTAIPSTALGKVDRVAARTLMESLIGQGRAWRR